MPCLSPPVKIVRLQSFATVEGAVYDRASSAVNGLRGSPIGRGIPAYLGNEAELAGVLGHEIGHVTEHSDQFIHTLYACAFF
jgi:hypothetical protein